MSTTVAQVTTCFYLLMEIVCWLHVLFVLIFIIFLFIYSKWCQQNQVEPTTCFYLLMQIASWLHVVFLLILIIYLFIYSKRCQQKQVNRPPVFIYLCKSLVVKHGFRFNIQYLFVYLFKVMWGKAGRTDHLYLFTYANHLLWKMLFVLILIFSVSLFNYSKWCQVINMEPTTLFYLLI